MGRGRSGRSVETRTSPPSLKGVWFRLHRDPNGIRRIRNRAPVHPVEILDVAFAGAPADSRVAGWLSMLECQLISENGIQVHSRAHATVLRGYTLGSPRQTACCGPAPR